MFTSGHTGQFVIYAMKSDCFILVAIERGYMQVGNAVAVPIARALGYSLGMASYMSRLDGERPLFKLPPSFISVNQEPVARTSAVLSGAKDVESEQGLD